MIMRLSKQAIWNIQPGSERIYVSLVCNIVNAPYALRSEYHNTETQLVRNIRIGVEFDVTVRANAIDI